MRWNDSNTYCYKSFDGFSDEDTKLAHDHLVQDRDFTNVLILWFHQRGDQTWREPILTITQLIVLVKEFFPTQPEIQFHELAIKFVEDWNTLHHG